MGVGIILSNIPKLAMSFLTLKECRFNKFPNKDKNRGKKAYVMGNGPSLKDVMRKYSKGEFQISSDSFFVNMAPLDAVFYDIKPSHLFLSDFLFAQEVEGRTERVREMYDMLQEKVDWDLTIYVNLGRLKHCKQLVEYSRLTNPHISFIFLNRNHCDNLYAPWRHWLYDKGWFMPIEATVVNTAIYVAILEGYSEIELYGVEHNMFKNLVVNFNNQLCIVEKNFYDKKETLVPVVNDGPNSSAGKISDYMFFIWKMFDSHRLLSEYAGYRGCKIYNCTPGSMIDVYERKETY